jgi:hypothetical protein
MLSARYAAWRSAARGISATARKFDRTALVFSLGRIHKALAMKKENPSSSFVEAVKKVLKDNGFRCRGNRCTPKREGELLVSIDFRNRWGAQIHDIGITIKDEDAGWLLTGDLHFLFSDFMTIFHEFRPEEVLAMDNHIEEQLRGVFTRQIIPSALAWTDPERFLMDVDAGRFVKNGILMPAVEKLRARQRAQRSLH